MTFAAKHISVAIERTASEVYAFASNPENLPRWASGLSGAIERVGDAWVADSPMGKVTVKFADRNEFGVLDHDVTLASGETFYNPMRAIPNGDGCEVVFTLYRRPEMSEEQLSEDARVIEKDLKKLKEILEGRA